MEESESENKISKYSSGVNILIRLDGLWKQINLYATANSYEKWNSYLDRVWCELARDLKDGQSYKDKKEEFDEFDNKIAKAGKFDDKAPEGFKDITAEQINKRKIHYKCLMEKELFLRRLENELGKGTTWSDGDEDDFD